MTYIQRAINKQAKLEADANAPYTFPELDVLVAYDRHLRNQAKLARAVIEAAMAVNDTNERDFSAHDSAYLIGEAKMSKLHFALQAWADHVNGETP